MAGTGRGLIIAALAVGTFTCFWALEWAGQGQGAAGWPYLLWKMRFLVSLALAVALPIVLVIFGLIGLWVDRETRHPLPGAAMAGFAFAWALGVTFPMLRAR